MYVSPSLPSLAVGASAPLNNSAPLRPSAPEAPSAPLRPFVPFKISLVPINSSTPGSYLPLPLLS